MLQYFELCARAEGTKHGMPACIWNEYPLPNVWLGVSVHDQASADERLPILLQTPAAKRFVSIEPCLGAVDLRGIWQYCPDHDFDGGFCGGPCSSRRMVDLVILGFESGPEARPGHPDNARSVRDQCQAAGVPYFFKQHGEYRELQEALRIPELARFAETTRAIVTVDGVDYVRVGKKAAGRLLDGQIHDGIAL